MIALVFAVPLLALALGVGNVARATHSLGSGTQLPQPPGLQGLGNGAHGMLLEEVESEFGGKQRGSTL
ncbi:MAG TPA: hypothetical protein VN837_22005 [Chloroflexota bacterium]|nr:hypothetical protein [Chloroflexota bacterium]